MIYHRFVHKFYSSQNLSSTVTAYKFIYISTSIYRFYIDIRMYEYLGQFIEQRNEGK